MVRADIRSRTLPANVLLASRQSQTESAFAVAIGCLSDQSSGHLTQIRRAGSHESDARTTELRCDSETLTLTNRDVRAKLTRRFKESERQGFGSHAYRDSAGAMSRRCDFAERLHDAEAVWISSDDAQQVGIRELL